MSDVAIEFKNQIFYGDALRASVAVGEYTRTGFELFYKLEKEIDVIFKPVAYARTGMVCYNYSLRKVVAVPEEVSRKLGA